MTLYMLIRYLRKIGYPLPELINGQLTDLICMPVVLMLCLAGLRVIKRNSELIINHWLIALICLEYTLIFEWFLPQKSSIYVADWKDGLMYFAGGMIFYFMQPKFKHKTLKAPNK